MMSVITVPGAACPINRYWAMGPRGIYVTSRGRAYRRSVREAVLSLSPGHVPSWARKVVVSVVSVVARMRRDGRPFVDVDAFIKPTLDALTHAGVWDDDSVVDELRATRSYDKSYPRIEIQIEWEE
jgi:Holliday junction resolvase RusA-like endonuclease